MNQSLKCSPFNKNKNQKTIINNDIESAAYTYMKNEKIEKSIISYAVIVLFPSIYLSI